MHIQPIPATPAFSPVIKPPTDARQGAEDAAEQLEQVFVQFLVQGLRKSMPTSEGGGLFGDGPGAGTYEDWFDTHLSRQLGRGDGIGIAKGLLQDWERHGFIPPAPSREGLDVTA